MSPGRAGITAPVSPGRTRINIPAVMRQGRDPCPQAGPGQGSVTPGRAGTGSVSPCPQTGTGSVSPGTPNHAEPCSSTGGDSSGVPWGPLLAPSHTPCPLPDPQGGAQRSGHRSNWSRGNAGTLNMAGNNDFKNVSFCKLIKAHPRQQGNGIAGPGSRLIFTKCAQRVLLNI